jgi:hypothetical protein
MGSNAKGLDAPTKSIPFDRGMDDRRVAAFATLPRGKLPFNCFPPAGRLLKRFLLRQEDVGINPRKLLNRPEVNQVYCVHFFSSLSVFLKTKLLVT